MALYEYKTTERGSRVQNVEEAFSKGMYWSDMPLAEGYVKTLVNFDLKDNGASIVPRAGYQMYEHYGNPHEAAIFDALTHTFELSTARYRADLGYREFVLAYSNKQDRVYAPNGPSAGYKDGNPCAYYGRCIITAGSPRFDENGNPTEGTGEGLPDSWLPYVKDTWCFDTIRDIEEGGPTTRAHVIYPTDGSDIHGMSISTAHIPRAEHIGVPAYNNNYYFYTETNSSPECCVIVYDVWYPQPVCRSYAPKAITAREAVTYGYNMLATDPYTFTNQRTGADSKVTFTGLLPYYDGKLCMSPSLNQPLEFVATAVVPDNGDYRYVAEWTTPTSIKWETIKDWRVQGDYTKQISFSFTPTTEEAIIRISAYRMSSNTSDALVDSTLAVHFSFNKNAYGSTANIDNKVYSVSKATGLCFWQQRIVAWGIPEDETMLFVSDVNDPTYFPYPNNVDTFTAPIRKCVAFQDSLLVFTADALYMLTMNDDGAGWNTKLIQHNLYITPFDATFIRVVKNMVFFKAHNYYFMVVPKATSLTGELTIAAVSKPLYALFDNFEDSVRSIFKNTYAIPYDTQLDLCNAYNYLDFEDVHNVYTFIVGDNDVGSGSTLIKEYTNLDLIYNIVDRTWRVYTYTSPTVYAPYKSVATQHGELAAVTWHESPDTASTGHSYKIPLYSLVKQTPDVLQDKYIAFEELGPGHITQDMFSGWNNYQLLDTGNREHVSTTKKRYREVQYTLNNTSKKNISFKALFSIDDRAYIKDDTQDSHILYGGIYDIPITPGTWTMDLQIPANSVYWKSRMPVAGKGYTPRLILRNTNVEHYELFNISWAYRPLYSR